METWILYYRAGEVFRTEDLYPCPHPPPNTIAQIWSGDNSMETWILYYRVGRGIKTVLSKFLRISRIFYCYVFLKNLLIQHN